MPTYLSYKQGFTLHHVFSVGSSGSERIGQEAAAVISLIMALGAALL